jgi:Nif-specific regulatory protein
VSTRGNLGAALSAIARTVAESLELKDVFSRVAEAMRQVLPFDAMGVNVVDSPDLPPDEMSPEDLTFSVYAVVGERAAEEIGKRRRLSDSSHGVLLMEPGRVVRYSDATIELDPSLPLDREIVEYGVRSTIVTLLPGARPLGTVWFASKQVAAYGPEDEATVLAIADLLALALEHERLFRKERERRRRSEALEALLPALAKALDVREVFDQLSRAATAILSHDRMLLTFFDEETQGVRIHAYSGQEVAGLPEVLPLAAEEWMRREEPEIVADARRYHAARSQAGDAEIAARKDELLREDGIRSFLRVPIRLEGQVVGALVFLSRELDQFHGDDIEVAGRIADQIALALSHERLAHEARRAAEAREEARRLEGRVATLTEQLAELGGTRRIIGRSASWRAVLDLVAKVAPTDTTVLLTGESGTGKEVVARAIHGASPRAGRPFLAINCAALPEPLLESELFGHERGAFTGALERRAGKIEQAAGGVLFLDEVGEMSPGVQAKFLRVLQEREFQRLGGSRVQKADVRVIAATNRDLALALERGQFREDLYYRLRVFEIALPPLRERKDDILPLAEAFAEEIGRTLGSPEAGISRAAREALLAYPWPGNVRELRNAIERALILSDGGLIAAEHLPLPGAETSRAAAAGLAPGKGLEDVERQLVENAMRETRHNKARAARLLGITRAQLYTRLQRYGIQ